MRHVASAHKFMTSALCYISKLEVSRIQREQYIIILIPGQLQVILSDLTNHDLCNKLWTNQNSVQNAQNNTLWWGNYPNILVPLSNPDRSIRISQNKKQPISDLDYRNKPRIKYQPVDCNLVSQHITNIHDMNNWCLWAHPCDCIPL